MEEKDLRVSEAYRDAEGEPLAYCRCPRNLMLTPCGMRDVLWSTELEKALLTSWVYGARPNG